MLILCVAPQVPIRLGKACCQLLDTPWEHAVYVAMRPWMFLLQAATAAGISPEDSAPSTKSVSSTAVAIGQQLLQSGLLQRLPVVVTTVAERLQAAAGLGPAGMAGAAAAAWASMPALTRGEAEELEVGLLSERLSCVPSSLMFVSHK